MGGESVLGETAANGGSWGNSTLWPVLALSSSWGSQDEPGSDVGFRRLGTTCSAWLLGFFGRAQAHLGGC